MKKVVLTFLISFLAVAMSFAQANRKGNINVNVGLGFSPTYYSDVQEQESQPIHFTADYSIFSFLSAGLSWGLSGGSEPSTYESIPARLVSSYNTFSLRASGHLPLFDRLDVYAGGSVGLQRISEVFREQINGTPLPEIPDAVVSSNFQPALHVGVRWRFLGNIGFYAEGGYGLSLVQAGLNMKL